MSEIRYGKTTLPECCKSVGERQKEPFRSTLFQIYRIMRENTGECFPEVFCHNMEICMKELPLTGADKDAFLAFVKGDSFGDGRMQLRMIERSREMLVVTADKLEKENAEKCRLAVGLGAMSGLLLVIILI